MLNNESLEAAWKRLDHFYKPVSQITPLEIIPDNKKICEKCLGVLRTFFSKGVGKRSPLKGFLFEGVPGTGKTELVRQIARRMAPYCTEREAFFLLFVDGATIAAPKWGEAENTLQAIFSFREFLEREKIVDDPRVIVLFDDIESLMLARTSDVAKEWHYSINAVLFHRLDEVDASKTFIFATTNKPKLVDDALRDRLYSIKFKPPSMKSLDKITEELLKDIGDLPEHMRLDILNGIKEKLKQKKSPTIRDVEREVIVQCIESGVW